MTAERFVVDTNVLISAALRETSTPRAVLRRIEDTRGALLFSDETFEELRTRLQRSRFTRYIDPEDRDVFLAQLLRISEWIAKPNAAAVLDVSLRSNESFAFHPRTQAFSDEERERRFASSDTVRVPLAPTSQPPTTGTPKAVVTLGPCYAPCEQSSVVVLLKQQSSKARESKPTIRNRDVPLLAKSI